MFYAIQDYIEDHGGYVEIHLNRKVPEFQKEYLLQFSIQLEKQEEIIKYIKCEMQKNHIKDIYVIVKNILDYGINITKAIESISNMLSPDNIFKQILNQIIR
mgnify:CR=1 FL=1